MAALDALPSFFVPKSSVEEKKQIKFKHFLFVKIRCTIAKYLCTVKLKKTVIMGLLDFLFLARL